MLMIRLVLMVLCMLCVILVVSGMWILLVSFLCIWFSCMWCWKCVILVFMCMVIFKFIGVVCWGLL